MLVISEGNVPFLSSRDSCDSVGVAALAFADETSFLGINTAYSAEPVCQEFLKVYVMHIQ